MKNWLARLRHLVSGPPGGITCQEALERMYEYLDGELDPERSDRVRRHLEVCRRCWPRFELERAFIDHIRSRGLRPTREHGLEERIRKLLDEVEAD